MLSWGGINRPMKMGAIPRAQDKKPAVNNNLEYQIESLHKYGDEHPESGLKNKVKRFQFSQKIDVMDPIKKTIEAKPMKPFMVNQLTMAIEREQLILSPFDELLHKQLVDYEVIRMSANGNPVFTDVNEHFVDALGLAFLAFALEFPEITKTIDKPTFKADAVVTESPLKERALKSLETITKGFAAMGNPWKSLKNGTISYEDSLDSRDADQPKAFPVSVGWLKARCKSGNSWGGRIGGSFGRSMF